MKYVLIISALYPPEPVVSARLSADLYESLKDSGYSVRVLHPQPSRPDGFSFVKLETIGDDEVLTSSYVCPKSSLVGRVRESWSFGSACIKYIREHSSEISCIYANTWPMFSQMAIVKIAKRYSIPCVMHIQDVYPESLTNRIPGLIGTVVYSFIIPMDKYILRNCTKIVTISDKMKAYLARTRGIDPGKVSVVTNWQNEKEFLDYQKDAKGISNEHPFTFMYLGNIGPLAGVDVLIDAFIQAKFDDKRLVIAGSGSMKEQLMTKASNYKGIVFWDVPNGKVPEIQSKADVLILPIKKGAASSSIPSKLPAYMFSAKPIIGCVDEDSDTAHAIKEADCGWVLEPENVIALTERMRLVASLDQFCLKEKSVKAQAYGLSHFSKEENLNRLIKVIEVLI